MDKILKKKQLIYLINLSISMIIFLSAYSFMNAVSRYIIDGFDDISSKLIIISNKSQSGLSQNSPRSSLDWETYEKLKLYMGDLYHISPIIRHYEVTTTVNNRRTAVAVWRTEPDFFTTTGLDIIEGRSFTEFESVTNDKKCLLSEKLKPDFIPYKKPHAATISLYQESCDLIGVTSSAEIVPILSMAENIYMPLNSANITNPKSKTQFTHIFLRSKNSEHNESAETEIRQALTLVSKNINVDIWYAKEFWQLQKKIAHNLQLLVMSITGVIIGLAGLSLANNLSLNVVERTGEIGLRIALGATKKDIFVMFLKEGLTVVLLGGISGIILGTGIIKFIIAPMVNQSRQLGEVTMQIDLMSLVVSFAVLICTSLLANIIPANKAVHIDASQAIREI